MARLAERTACNGLLPRAAGDVSLRETVRRPAHALSPYRDRAEDLSRALSHAHGLGLSSPGRYASAGPAKVIWTGLDQWLLTGVAPGDGLRQAAAVVDQTDAWAWVAVEGRGVWDVLARLTPVALARAGCGSALRAPLGHMSAILLVTGSAAAEVAVFRSMAGTLVHDLVRAAETVAARRRAGL